MPFEDVQPGQPISRLASFWNGLHAEALRNRLLPGVNVRLTSTPDGTMISGAIPAANWSSPWLASINGLAMQFVPGTVDGVVPTINGTPMTAGLNGAAGVQPSLTLQPSLFSNNATLIVVEVTCDASWNTKSVAIVQVVSLDGAQNPAPNAPLLPPNLPGQKTRCPICRVRVVSGSYAIDQFARFDMTHIAVVPVGGSPAAPRHLFQPAA